MYLEQISKDELSEYGIDAPFGWVAYENGEVAYVMGVDKMPTGSQFHNDNVRSEDDSRAPYDLREFATAVGDPLEREDSNSGDQKGVLDLPENWKVGPKNWRELLDKEYLDE
jgi:hypothetical protein